MSFKKDLADQKTKQRYYPNLDKRDVLGAFVAGGKSSHSRGSTADIIIRREAFLPLFMGAP